MIPPNFPMCCKKCKKVIVGHCDSAGCDVDGIPTGKKYENFLVLRFSDSHVVYSLQLLLLRFLSQLFLMTGNFQKEKSTLIFDGYKNPH